jgi:hypothetical protein
MKRLDINPLPPNFAKYINLVADVELKQAFDESVRQLSEIDTNLLEILDGKRYAPDKWTVNDILQHLADARQNYVVSGPNAGAKRRKRAAGFR